MPIQTRAARKQLKETPVQTEIPANQKNHQEEKSEKRREQKNRPYLQNITNPKVKPTKEIARKKEKPTNMRTLSRMESAAVVEESTDTPPPTVIETTVDAEEVPTPLSERETGALKRKSVEVAVVALKENTEQTPTAADTIKKSKQNETAEDQPKDIQNIMENVTEEQSVKKVTEAKTSEITPPQEKATFAFVASTPAEASAAVVVDKDPKPSTSLNAPRISLKAPTQSSPTTATGGGSTTSAATTVEQTLPRAAATRTLPEKLLAVISNLYLDAPGRLCLDFTPRCAENLSFCHQHHYRAPLPEAPTQNQAQNLRCALQQQRYVSFVNLTLDICQRGEFPGEGIFTKLIELLLSLNAKTYNNSSLSQTYNKSIELFGLIVRTFPPCWLALRPFYISFFQRPLDSSKITPKNKPPLSKSTRIFEILLDLLEHTLDLCTDEELHEHSFVDEHAATAAAPSGSPSVTSPQATTAANLSEPQSLDLSACSEFYNQWDWEEREHNLQTFVALSAGCRLERLFVVMRLLLQILESDFVLWILHHHKTTKDWIFCESNRPLVVVVFELTMYTRFSGVVRRVFALFASAVSKGLSRARLQIIERYIALLMVASNTADMENTVIGVKYPYLGTQTKNLIREFFKIFKAHNTTAVSTYIQTIDILRIPYVRYQFIDHFLQLFYFAHTEEMSPKKICYDMAKKRWLKYRPQAELASSDDELSREQYLKMLLDALRMYCEWHGSNTFLRLIAVNEAAAAAPGETSRRQHLKPIQTATDSVHRWPTRGAGAIGLDKMAKDIPQLEQQLKLTVRMSKPKVDLPIADICIDDEIITKYRNDLKFVMILHDMLPKHVAAHPDVNFGDWQAFLSDFAPRSTT